MPRTNAGTRTAERPPAASNSNKTFDTELDDWNVLPKYVVPNTDEITRIRTKPMARDAAVMEDATEKSPLSPGPLKPARESLGEMLLEMGRPADALAAFEATTDKEPNRFRGLYGAAIAASKSGDAGKARMYFSRLVTICAKGDEPGRSELQDARYSAKD